MLSLIKDYNITFLKASEEAKKLVRIYIKEDMITKNNKQDGLHIAIASIKKLDLIVSVNFKHINKKKVKKLVGLINEKVGYSEIKIVEPMEVVADEKK